MATSWPEWARFSTSPWSPLGPGRHRYRHRFGLRLSRNLDPQEPATGSGRATMTGGGISTKLSVITILDVRYDPVSRPGVRQAAGGPHRPHAAAVAARGRRGRPAGGGARGAAPADPPPP